MECRTMKYKWAATHTLTFKEWKAEKFVEYQDALDYAEEKRPYKSTYIWKLTEGKPLAWVEIA